MIITFIIGLIFLVFFSYLDIRYNEVENFWIAAMLGTGIIISLLDGNFIPAMVACAVIFGLGYILWRFGNVGGADIKVAACLPFFLPTFNLTPLLNISLIIWFSVVVIIYSTAFKIFRKNKRKKNIPGIPALLLFYLLIWALT